MATKKYNAHRRAKYRMRKRAQRAANGAAGEDDATKNAPQKAGYMAVPTAATKDATQATEGMAKPVANGRKRSKVARVRPAARMLNLQDRVKKLEEIVVIFLSDRDRLYQDNLKLQLQLEELKSNGKDVACYLEGELDRQKKVTHQLWLEIENMRRTLAGSS